VSQHADARPLGEGDLGDEDGVDEHGFLQRRAGFERAGGPVQRLEKGAEAVRSALEMADLFSQLRAAAAR
jgi:hypothetical protein